MFKTNSFKCYTLRLFLRLFIKQILERARFIINLHNQEIYNVIVI